MKAWKIVLMGVLFAFTSWGRSKSPELAGYRSGEPKVFVLNHASLDEGKSTGDKAGLILVKEMGLTEDEAWSAASHHSGQLEIPKSLLVRMSPKAGQKIWIMRNSKALGFTHVTRVYLQTSDFAETIIPYFEIEPKPFLDALYAEANRKEAIGAYATDLAFVTSPADGVPKMVKPSPLVLRKFRKVIRGGPCKDSDIIQTFEVSGITYLMHTRVDALIL